MIVLGLDYGRKRTGVAIGNLATFNARPLAIVEGRGERRMSELEKIIAEWRPVRLVVGLPVHMDGSEHANTRKAREFGRRISRLFSLPVDFADERLTTDEVRREKPESQNRDAEAAAIILRDWLRQKESVPTPPPTHLAPPTAE